jgi:hypothetical protein
MSKDAIKLLKSSNAVIVVLVLALLAQMPHAQYVMFSRSREHDLLGLTETIIGAVALEIAVLVFAVRGNVKVSWGFAAFSVCVNLAYYYDTPASLWTPTNWLLSAGLPIAIALYSHEITKKVVHGEEEDEPKPTAKRTTRTVRSTQTVEASEQVEEQPVQFAIVEPVQLEDNGVQIDLASLSIEQKKVYALDVMRGGKVNMSKLADELKVQRPRLYEWKKELA